MAGGKLSPRQKMINLMYLVFIAMLALNMSKEVLSAFGLMNEKFDSVNSAANKTNEDMLAVLNEKAKEAGAEFGGAAAKANELQKITKDFYSYLDGIKGEVLKGTETDEMGKLPYEQMDKGDNLDNLWFSPKGYSPKGQEVVAKFEGFKNDVSKILGNENKYKAILNEIISKFSTEDVTNKDGQKVKFLDYHFKGFPAVASLAKLSAYQNDIKKLETDVYSAALGKAAVEAASMTKFQAILALDKNAYFSGETVTGKVVLGKYDDQIKFAGFSGPGRLENGQAIISTTAGGVGEQNIGGSFSFLEDGKTINLPWKGTYVVVPRPNQATISADKMNVVYRGLENPMSISFAGVGDNNVNASAAGLTKTGNGKYMMRPGAGTEVVINVNAKLPDGKTVSDSKKFRIKSPPPPTGHLRGEYDVVRGPAQSLSVSTVTAKSLDFDFDMTWTVNSFVIKVPGQATVRVTGGSMNGAAQAAIKKATRGDQVTISEIIATGTGGVKLKAAPVVYEVQ
jgi:gliding motility-associated protein GldM